MRPPAIKLYRLAQAEEAHRLRESRHFRGKLVFHTLSAALTAQEVFDKQNKLRLAAGVPPIKYGIALHIGDVLYGNIGSETRLDFTVIGPAVNLTARIESLCRDLGRSVLLSADFVRTSGVTADPLGEFALKGVRENHRVFAPQQQL